MKTVLSTLHKIVPEQMILLERRYNILRAICYTQPIGRRTLSNHLHMSERIVRTEIDFFSQQGFIEVSPIGMVATTEGQAIIEQLHDLIREIKGLTRIERQLQEMLRISRIIIVPGNSDEDEAVKKDIGKAASQILKDGISQESVIAITGGSTIAQMVESISTVSSGSGARLVVPARGGVGNTVEYQSDTMAAKLAKKLGAGYRLLNIPDNLSKKTIDELKNEPQIQATLYTILKANVLVFGIGDPFKMAKRRRLSSTIIDFLIRKQAVAEAFGYYFNAKGDIVYSSRSMGIKLEDVKKIPFTIAVAGGASKAKAILATSHLLQSGTLIMDEGAAEQILAYNP